MFKAAFGVVVFIRFAANSHLEITFTARATFVHHETGKKTTKKAGQMARSYWAYIMC